MNTLHPYDYLKEHIPGGEGINDNWFVNITEEEIVESEKRLGNKFPAQLRQFYEEIGTGCLRSPKNVPDNYRFYGKNEILRPSVVADIILLGHDSGYISQETLDLMEPGDLPFFEIGDSSSFLFMKPQGKHPNAVYYFNELIEPEFKDFIWKLYHVSPSYYEDLF